jgi:hypothetical protein
VVQYKILGPIGWGVVVLLVAGFVWAIWQSKREVVLPITATTQETVASLSK